MVASFATTTHSRSAMRPMPQMIEAECTSPPYMPQAASWPISRKGEPGSSSLLTRSRGSIFPRPTCLSRAEASPPSATVWILSFRSPTRLCMRSALARNSAERGLRPDLRTLISARAPEAAEALGGALAARVEEPVALAQRLVHLDVEPAREAREQRERRTGA